MTVPSTLWTPGGTPMDSVVNTVEVTDGKTVVNS
jgi:hypothetical protein